MAIVNAESSTIQDLKQVMQNQGIESKNLRIISQIGWSGVSFQLALDEPTKDDVVEKIEDLQFVVAEHIHKMYKSFTITSQNYGPNIMFNITSDEQQDSDGCASCSSCGH